MVKCKRCGKPIRTHLKKCPHCGPVNTKGNYDDDLMIDDLVLLGIVALFAMP